MQPPDSPTAIFSQFFGFCNPNEFRNTGLGNLAAKIAHLSKGETPQERLQPDSEALSYLNRLFQLPDHFHIAEFRSHLKNLSITQLNLLGQEATKLFQERKASVTTLKARADKAQDELSKRCKRVAIPALAGVGGVGMRFLPLLDKLILNSKARGKQMTTSVALMAIAGLYAFGPSVWHNYQFKRARVKLREICCKVNEGHRSIFSEKRKRIEQNQPILSTSTITPNAGQSIASSP